MQKHKKMTQHPSLAFGEQKSTGLRETMVTSVTSYKQIGKKGLKKGVTVAEGIWR